MLVHEVHTDIRVHLDVVYCCCCRLTVIMNGPVELGRIWVPLTSLPRILFAICRVLGSIPRNPPFKKNAIRRIDHKRAC